MSDFRVSNVKFWGSDRMGADSGGAERVDGLCLVLRFVAAPPRAGFYSWAVGLAPSAPL